MAEPVLDRELKTYTLRMLKLGDTWSVVSWLLQQQDVALTEYSRPRRAGNMLMRPFVEEIQSLMETEKTIHFVPGCNGDRVVADVCYHHKYLPTKLRWSGSHSRTVCIHVDGRWKRHLKNPSPEETMHLVQTLEAWGFLVKFVGQPLSLIQTVRELSQCLCFIGVDSGIMHVACSVRCPRILLRNKMFDIDRIFKGKSITMSKDVSDALRIVREKYSPAESSVGM